MASEIVVTIDGVFSCSSCVKNEYGTQVGIVEVGDTYPMNFTVQLPDGHMWDKGETFRLHAVTNPVQFAAKAGGSKFMKFVITDYKKVPVRFTVEEIKPGK